MGSEFILNGLAGQATYLFISYSFIVFLLIFIVLRSYSILRRVKLPIAVILTAIYVLLFLITPPAFFFVQYFGTYVPASVRETEYYEGFCHIIRWTLDPCCDSPTPFQWADVVVIVPGFPTFDHVAIPFRRPTFHSGTFHGSTTYSERFVAGMRVPCFLPKSAHDKPEDPAVLMRMRPSFGTYAPIIAQGLIITLSYAYMAFALVRHIVRRVALRKVVLPDEDILGDHYDEAVLMHPTRATHSHAAA